MEIVTSKHLDPPGRQVLRRPDRLLEIQTRTAIDAVSLHQLQEVGSGLPVRRLKPSAFDL